MERKFQTHIASEVDTAVRLRKIAESEVVRRIVEFIDLEFHGVVPLPIGEPVVPETKAKPRT